MKSARRLLVTGTAIAACAATVVTVAHATENPATAQPAGASADQPGYAVEDFAYPGADKIEKERGIVLKRGDGHIVLADCTSTGELMEVYSRGKDRICFRVTGRTGYLSLEIPGVYGVKADAAHKAEMTLTADGNKQNISLAKNQWKAAGETADPQGRPHVLMEISTSL